MKKFKFILLMLVTALIVMPVLSCTVNDGDNGGINQNDPLAPADPSENGESGESAEEIEKEPELVFPDLPDVNFGGYEFRILNSRTQAAVLVQLVSEAEVGEALNDAIFRRNRRMEAQFGFELVQTEFPGPGGVRDSARRSIQAGADDFDLAMVFAEQALPMAQDSMIERMDSIPYIDLSRPWWDQDMNRDFSIGGRLFFTSGDFSFNQYSATMVMLFNQELHADLGLDCPYTLVREGRWTLERFGEQARTALRDLNGDGIFDHNDQWGLTSISFIYTIGFMNGAGARYVIKDADDLPVLNLNTEGFISRFQTVFDLLTEPWLYDRDRPETTNSETAMFLNGQVLFWTDLVNWATRLRAMDQDFGLLPHPKLNEQQEHHISGVGRPHVMIVPVTTDNLERTGIILEALSAESRLTTLPVYFDTMLVNQVMNRDEESGEMLELVFAHRVYEIGRQFWTSNIADPIAHAFRDRNRDIVAIIERNESAANAAIAAAVAALLDN